jgi:antitoxin component YwqK of YwqJK toxin-antitoxin module
MRRKIVTLITCTSLAVMALSACGSKVNNVTTGNKTSTDNVQEELQTVLSEESTDKTDTVLKTQTLYLCTKETYYDENGVITSQCEYEYDEYGNKTKVVNTNGDGSVTVVQYTREYDDNNNILKETSYNEDGTSEEAYEATYYSSGEIKERTNYYNGVIGDYYEYDENGNSLLHISYYDGEEYYRYAYEYDQNGNEIKSTCTTEDGETVTTYEYASNNTLLHEVSYYSDGTVKEDITYDSYGNAISDIYYGEYESDYSYENEYDYNGNLIKNTVYNSDELSYYVIYDYDDNGNCILMEDYDGDSKTPYEVSEWEYDKAGNMLHHSQSRDGVLYQYEEYVYDSKGNLISNKYEYYNDDGSVDIDISYSASHTYDSNGNMISTILFAGDGSINLSDECEYTAIEVPVE